MFFVWTSGGGPLQYIGLALILIQFLPQYLVEARKFNIANCCAAVAAACVVVAGVVLVGPRISLWGFRQQARDRLQQWTGREWSNLGVSCLSGVLAGMLAMIICFISVDTIRWLPYLTNLCTVLSFVGILRQHLQQHQQHAPPRQHRYNDAQRQDARLEELTELVRHIPLEPFMEGEYAGTSVSQLKQMLKRRGMMKDELSSFVDRQNLVEALNKRRQYSDTCCICFEDFQKDESLRILPGCCHELHVECFDKWVYTFATNVTKARQDPTCPLCKVGIKRKVR